MGVKILPALMILESIAASVIYFIHGDWKRGMYWGGSVILQVGVILGD